MASQGIVPLEELDAATQAGVSILLANCQHVGVQVGVAPARARYRQRKSDQLFALECTDHLPTNLLRYNE